MLLLARLDVPLVKLIRVFFAWAPLSPSHAPPNVTGGGLATFIDVSQELIAVDQPLPAAIIPRASDRPGDRPVAAAYLAVDSTRGVDVTSAEFFQVSTRQVEEHLIARGEITSEEVGAYCRMLDDPDLVIMAPTIVAAWRRKPDRTP
jgi:hypothetical protein